MSSSVVLALIIHILRVFIPLSVVVTIYAKPLLMISLEMLSVKALSCSSDNPSGSYRKLIVPQDGLEIIFQSGSFSNSFFTWLALKNEYSISSANSSVPVA